VFSIVLLSPACFEGKTTQNKIAIYTAQVDSGLVAVADAVNLLHSAGRLSSAASKSVYDLDLKILEADDLIRERAKTGFDKASALVIIDNLIDDAKKIEEAGVLNLNDADKARFQEVAGLLQFSLRSLQAIIKAIKPPALTTDEKIRASHVLAVRRDMAPSTLATQLILIVQEAIIKSLDQSRMTTEEAFADGDRVTESLRETIKARLAAL
jgi:hypothetical protein